MLKMSCNQALYCMQQQYILVLINLKLGENCGNRRIFYAIFICLQSWLVTLRASFLEPVLHSEKVIYRLFFQQFNQGKRLRD